VEKSGPLYIAGRMWNGAATLENSFAVPQMLDVELLYESAFSPQGIYPRELKTSTQ